MTARDLFEDVERDKKTLREQYMSAPFASAGTLIGNVLPEEMRGKDTKPEES